MTTDQLVGWFAGRLPDGWFEGSPEIRADREEIQVIGRLPAPDLPEDASEDVRRAACLARIQGFREDTRAQRIRIAQDAEALFRRKVSWGARCGDEEQMFTTLALPAMTRLRLEERAVLDTLVEAGVARSRSHALAWCVRLVAERQEEWLAELKEALRKVRDVREEGPRS